MNKTDLKTKLFKLMDNSMSFQLFAPQMKGFFKLFFENTSEFQLQNAIDLIEKNALTEQKLGPYFTKMKALQTQADQLTRKANLTVTGIKSDEDKQKGEAESMSLIESLKNL